jgi:DNA-binding winged helix-turn-helix (wHTH) protein
VFAPVVYQDNGEISSTQADKSTKPPPKAHNLIHIDEEDRILDAYDVKSFELDYCQADASKIAAAIRAKASLLVIGMPGCGKSRLIDFLLQRPGVREKYGLSPVAKFIKVDGDIVTTQPQGVYLELLRALGHQLGPLNESHLDGLKHRLISEVEKLEPETDLVVFFDNFNHPLQQALGENFFNFLYALRNSRSKLNVVYIFMANLKIDLAGFYKMDRLFDKGPNRSICWLTLLNRQDTIFSIERQLHKAERKPDALSESDKEKIYQLTGGHALLTRYLTHLVLSQEASPEMGADQLLEHHGLYAACTAIWNDLEQNQKNFLIDLAAGAIAAAETSQPVKALQTYGVLQDQARFFSPLFERFVQTQEKTRVVVDAHCDETKTKIIVRTIDQQLAFTLNGLSQRKARLLCYLLANQGEVCSRDQLIEIGWPSDDKYGVSLQALSRQIDDIKGWLKQQPQLSQYIAVRTSWGEGYELVIRS